MLDSHILKNLCGYGLQFHFCFPNRSLSDLPKELAFDVLEGYRFKEQDVTFLLRVLMCSAYLLGMFASHFCNGSWAMSNEA